MTDFDVREMVGLLRMGKLLEDFRGAPPSDVELAVELLLPLSVLIDDVLEILRLDLTRQDNAARQATG